MPSNHELRVYAQRKCRDAELNYHHQSYARADTNYRESYYSFEEIPPSERRALDYFHLALICRDRAWIYYIDKNFSEMLTQFTLAVDRFSTYTKLIPSNYDKTSLILLSSLYGQAKLLAKAVAKTAEFTDTTTRLAECLTRVSTRNGNQLLADYANDLVIEKAQEGLSTPRCRV